MTVTEHPQPAAPTTTVADVLDDAADYIETNGWCQKTMYAAGDGPHPAACAMGAILRTAPEGHWFVGRAIDELAHTVGHTVRRSSVAWNDDPDRTEQQVLDMLRLAAKDARIEQDRAEGSSW
ncbi:MAG: DUF6197 family protein [Mycobacteriales bacterium]